MSALAQCSRRITALHYQDSDPRQDFETRQYFDIQWDIKSLAEIRT
jgi:hypothetical protein